MPEQKKQTDANTANSKHRADGPPKENPKDVQKLKPNAPNNRHTKPQ